jgi:hypothetical protein
MYGSLFYRSDLVLPQVYILVLSLRNISKYDCVHGIQKNANILTRVFLFPDPFPSSSSVLSIL